MTERSGGDPNDSHQNGSHQNDSPQHYDVVVGGAGIVGAALALSLATLAIEQPLKIALVEPQQADLPADDSFDHRVVALNESSRQLLDKLQVWEQAVVAGACPYTHMQVRDSEGTGLVEFDAADIQQDNLGHIVENSLLLDSLLSAIKQQDSIDLFCPDQINSLSRSGGKPLLIQLDQHRISASLLIAADGSQSKIRQLCDFRIREWDYGHSAIVATLRGEKSHQHKAWQWFMPTGPLAFLPMGDRSGDSHYVSIVWSQVLEQSDRLMAMGDAEFCRELTLASEHCMGDLELVSQRSSYPLRQSHGIDYVQPGVALIGDAAHAIHPLAGQGVNLGLSDVQVLTEELSRAVLASVDIGSEHVLRRYQRRRKPENLAVMALMEGFKRLYERDELPVRLLRNLGMSQFDALTPLKNMLIKQAMGLR